jgi:hypothetical protein
MVYRRTTFIMGAMKARTIIDVAGDFDLEWAVPLTVAILAEKPIQQTTEESVLTRAHEEVPLGWALDTSVRWFGVNE